MWEKERSERREGHLYWFIMGHRRHQALALIDLRVMQRAQPRGPLEGSLGCKYNRVFLLHTQKETEREGVYLFLSFTL